MFFGAQNCKDFKEGVTVSKELLAIGKIPDTNMCS